jgi:hypothetical protein
MLDIRSSHVNFARKIRAGAVRILALVLAFCALSAVAAECGKSVSEPIIQMELIAPLMAHIGPALKVTVGADGCVVAERPPYYAQPGRFAFRLEAAELRTLRSELAAVGPGRFDANAVKSELAKRSAEKVQGDTLYAVADGNLLRLRASGKDGGQSSIAWRNLEQDLLNFPDIESLVALAAARDLLLELGSDARLERLP